MTDTLIPLAPSTASPLEPHLGERPVWNDEDDQILACKRVIDVTHDVKTFLLEPMEPRTFRFRPGQYLTLTLNIGCQEVSRCYTISSPPTRPHLLSITVKRQPGGLVSNWLHDHLVPGDVVRAAGPLGRFSIAEHPAPKYLFLSGGSGITPLMSMTRTLYDLAEPTDLVLVHNARSPEDIIFRRELELIDATGEGIRVVPVCEQDSPSERWAGASGRLSVAMLLENAPDLLDREIFTCGPPAYMAAVRQMLTEAGTDHNRYHEESFSVDDAASPAVPTVPPAQAGAEETESRMFSVRFSRSNRVIECGEDADILDAALGAGVNLPSSCGQGMCGTCKCTLLEGSVDMQDAGGIRPREVAQNKILICCSKPTEDLVIDA